MHMTTHFFPVGQGLFSAGIVSLPQSPHGFQWVYDCGTLSERALLDTQLARFANMSPMTCKDGGSLGLVALSHFDADHINGVVALLQKFRVDILLLPYLTFMQRLMAARAVGIAAADPLLSFFLNPVEYLVQQDGVAIDRIVLVRGGSEQLTADAAGAPTPGANDDARGALSFSTAEPEGADQRADLQLFANSRTTNVSFLMSGAALRLDGLWEFLPYNDSDLAPKAPSQFRKTVESLRDQFMADPSGANLEAIRSAYDKEFGRSGVSRNAISMFLYVGPVVSQSPAGVTVNSLVKNTDSEIEIVRMTYSGTRRVGVLCTGDGYLNRSSRLNALLHHLGTVRVNNLHCVQVMHHGARKNWHESVAAALAPNVSVFCSDPLRGPTFHPHGEVVRDFLPYGPVQVDATRGFFVHSSW
jgi:hypothetical protein